MEAHKIVGGVLAGIGTVAALPVMGAVGTVSLAGAIVGGTLGGVVGAIAAETEEPTCSRRPTSPENDEEEPEPNLWLLELEKLQKEMDEAPFTQLVVALDAIQACSCRIGSRLISSHPWVFELREAIEELEKTEQLQTELDGEREQDSTLSRLALLIPRLDAETRASLLKLLDTLIPNKKEEDDQIIISPFKGHDETEVVEMVRTMLRNAAPQDKE